MELPGAITGAWAAEPEAERLGRVPPEALGVVVFGAVEWGDVGVAGTLG